MSKLYHAGSTPIASLPQSRIKKMLSNPSSIDFSFYEKLTPQTAQFIIDYHMFDRQRTIRKGQVKRLAGEIKNGRFRSVNPITFALNDNLKPVNVNGQHTLNAIVQSGIAIQALINFTPESAKDVYTIIDNHVKRNVFDAVNAIGEWDNLTIGDVKILGSACKILSNFDISRLENDPYKLKELVDTYTNSYLLYKNSVSNIGGKDGMPKKMLGRIPVVIGVALFHYSSPIAHKEIKQFFYEVTTADCDVNSPTRSLYKKYMKGRRKSWGSGHNEFKELLAYWYSFRAGLKNVASIARVWNLNNNLSGTDIRFTESSIK